ncbi:cell division protein PerM [Actinomyces capricornis]|uniref:Beta-carotene 15,15'-monooxygenase n=1 Tax=Actinomyces capricornis TaxID=2755559 RepID=A0ABM7U7Q5_9ACTO|nr:DUF6350 family protein [Actinomyces capricornis]BDA63519.1 hypothetical protein MANAM107_03530 [Actinomyces capricornis]
MNLKRLRPHDWGWALRAGLESVLPIWILVVLITVLVVLSASSLDAAAALSVGQAMRAGTGLWSLAFGGSIGVADSEDGVLGLPLLGITVLQWLWTRNCVRRARPAGLLSGLWTWACATGIAALVAQAGPVGSPTWPAVVGLSVLTALVIAWHLRGQGLLPAVLDRWWDSRPHWVSPGLSLARGATAALGVLSLLVLLAAAASSAGRVSQLHDSLAGGGFLASLGLIALQAAWLPTALVWAASWLVGSGFAVGEGTVFAPDRVVPGPVPSLPLLGLLPAGPLGGVGLFLPLVITAGAMVAAWRRRTVLYSLRVRYAVAAALLAGAVVALGMGAACLAASGPVGPGAMAEVGPKTGYAMLLVFLEVSAGLGAIAVLSHPYTLSLASGAVSTTALAATEAASGARQRVGDRVESAAESARERRAARARGSTGSASAASAPSPATAQSSAAAGDGRAGSPEEAGGGTTAPGLASAPSPHEPPEAGAPAPSRPAPTLRPPSPWRNWREQAAGSPQPDRHPLQGEASASGQDDEQS